MGLSNKLTQRWDQKKAPTPEQSERREEEGIQRNPELAKQPELLKYSQQVLRDREMKSIDRTGVR